MSSGRLAGGSGPLRHRGYRRFWLARTLSQCGDVARFTTLALLVYRLTGTGLGVSGVLAAEIAPVLLLGPFAGPLADRFSRVRLMVGADLLRAALALLLAAAHGSAAVAYLVAAGMSCGAVLFNPAAGSVLPGLVGPGELVSANAGIWTAAVGCQLVIAPLAGLLVTVTGYCAAFALDAASFFASAVLLAGLPAVPRAAGPAAGPAAGAGAFAGLRELAGLVLVRRLALCQLLAALSAGATSALLVVLARSRLHASPAGYGVLLAAIAAGAVAGPLLLLRRRPRDPPRPAILSAAFAARGAADLALAGAGSLLVAVPALAGYGAATAAGNVTFPALVQTRVPERLRGRAFAAFDVLWQTGRLASLAAGGLLADAAGVRWVYLCGAVLMLAASGAAVRVPLAD